MSSNGILEADYAGQMLWSHFSSMKGSLNESSFPDLMISNKIPKLPLNHWDLQNPQKLEWTFFLNYSANLTKNWKIDPALM